MGLFDSINNFVDNTFNTDIGGNNPNASSGLGGLLNYTADRTGMHNGGDFLNGLMQYASFGLLGYDSKSGSLKEGFLTHWGDEGIGELTGRNTARAALHQAQDQFNYSQQQAQALIAQQQWNQMNADLQASQSAKAATATALATGGANFSNTAGSAFGPNAVGSLSLGTSGNGRDFLGL